jgi:polysaccharide biosynthesis protein VpsQ
VANPPQIFLMKWLTILFTLFIVLIIVLADTGNLGIVGFVYRIPYADKGGHFLLYGILVLLINLTLFRSMPSQTRNRIVLVSGMTLAFLIGLEELSQQHFSNRTFDLVDLSASYLGVIFFSWLAIKTP